MSSVSERRNQKQEATRFGGKVRREEDWCFLFFFISIEKGKPRPREKSDEAIAARHFNCFLSFGAGRRREVGKGETLSFSLLAP